MDLIDFLEPLYIQNMLQFNCDFVIGLTLIDQDSNWFGLTFKAFVAVLNVWLRFAWDLVENIGD
jgi:hypothetical protein